MLRTPYSKSRRAVFSRSGHPPGGRDYAVLQVRNFADGPLIPLLSYVASCLGVFLGLRCATRARACHGASRGRWLLLAAMATSTL